MSLNDHKPKSLAAALEDHSAEGIAILSSEPSRLTRATIYIMISLLLTGLVWSFFGKADIMVTAFGKVGPESDVRRVYAPINGELVDIYIAEGMPVSKGDVLARINAASAIEAATRALQAEIKLAQAEREYRLFPTRKKVMELKLEALKRKIEVQEKMHEKLVAEGMTKLAEEQRLKLEKARAELDKARRARDVAREEAEKYERLFRMSGGGGVSRLQVQEKRNAYLAAKTAYRLAETTLGELEIELSKGYSQKRAEIEESFQRLTQLRVEYETQLDEIENSENQVNMELRTARLAAESATRISFDNIDEDNFLSILAPSSGVITELEFTQPGDKVDANKPLAGIAPEGTRTVLQVEIQERDRGFLVEGLPVKIKFSAFPYQRYGVINGILEYIAPATVVSSVTKNMVYKGRVGLDHDYFSVGEARFPLRYGMTATAEIVVRQRRLIDLALDPFRNVEGLM